MLCARVTANPTVMCNNNAPIKKEKLILNKKNTFFKEENLICKYTFVN